MVKAEQKLSYVDHLRVLLTCLVVAHHAGQAYGPTGGAWPVFEPIRSQLLEPFFAVNAGFFMGMFFLLAGYFLQNSLDRKGIVRFSADRLIRLGIPLFLVGFVVFALIGYGDAPVGQSFGMFYWRSYIGSWNVEFAHMWFVFHLLAYSLILASLLVLIPGDRGKDRVDRLGHVHLTFLVAAIAVTGAIARVSYTQDDWVKLLYVIPAEPVHLPQYVIMFLFGWWTGRRRLLDTIAYESGLIWLGIGMAAAIYWYLKSYLAIFAGIHLFSSTVSGFLFPIWEALLCVGLSVGLITFAREHWKMPSGVMAHLGRASYGVYILHVFIIVGFNMALLSIQLPPLAKFLIVTALTWVVAFTVVALLRTIPIVARVI